MPLADMQYAEGSTHAPPTGGVRIFPPGAVSFFLSLTGNMHFFIIYYHEMLFL